jgi:hypothetical protein
VTANKTPRTTTAERARVLIGAWDEVGEELQFVENADGTTVHVVARNRGSTADSGLRAFGLSVDEILDSHGHLKIPAEYVTEDGYQLGA